MEEFKNISKSFNIIDGWAEGANGSFASQLSWDSLPLYILATGWAVLTLVMAMSILRLSRTMAADRISRRSAAFVWFALWVFGSGLALYYIGYDYSGSHGSAVTLCLRSVLSSFEMFLSKSNLIGIADNCKGNMYYMLCFATIHALAVAVSMMVAVLCFGRRVQHWLRGKMWQIWKTDEALDVFWGLNEKSFALAMDIQRNSKTGDARFVFVDFPLQEESPSKGQSFSGILGLFSYKVNALKRIAGLRNFILLKSSRRPSAVEPCERDFLDSMNIYKLRRMMGKAGSVRFFIMTDDEESNLKAAINMLEAEVCGNEGFKIYCSARKTMLNRLIEEKWGDRLQLIDDSRTAVVQLKMDWKEGTHPIDYVDIDKEKGAVTSKFKALIVGFGTTGQDALRFIYEFSAFPDSDGRKSPVEIHVVDKNLLPAKGAFLQEVPALTMLEGKEIFFHEESAESEGFVKFIESNIMDLNYVVVATGSDDVNLEVASMIMDKALQRPTKRMERFKLFVRMHDDGNAQRFDTAVAIYQRFFPGGELKPLDYFGNTKALYTSRSIIENRYREQAELFYRSYCKAMGAATTWEERRRKEIKKLGEIYGHRSIRRKEGQDKANCQHCHTKLMLLGIPSDKYNPQRLLQEEKRGSIILPHSKECLPLPEWTESKSIIDVEQKDVTPWITRLYNASVCEHLRWNASHLMMGYLPMTDEVKSRTTESCDEVTKQHSCIVDWKELSCKTQSYDYAVVRTTIGLATEKRFYCFDN